MSEEKKFVSQGCKSYKTKVSRKEVLFWKKLVENSFNIPPGYSIWDEARKTGFVRMQLPRYSFDIINPRKVFGKEKEEDRKKQWK